MELTDRIESYISEFLHVEETASNKMIDLHAKRGGETIFLSDPLGEYGLSARMLELIREHYGRPGNTALRNSSASNIFFGEGKNILDWHFDGDDENAIKRLNTFIQTSNSELKLKGVNPLFLSLGAISWNVPDDDGKSFVTILTPLFIFPIRFIRASQNQPVHIEFVADDIRLNPCFLEKLGRLFGRRVSADFPMPYLNAENAVDLEKLNAGEYFNRVREYISRCVPSEGDSRFELVADCVSVSTFKSGDIAMYYDLLRNREKLERSPVVRKLLTSVPAEKHPITLTPEITLMTDSVQDEIITRAVNGDDLVIKGPPGTGKTLTIANLIAALIGAGKKVMFVSAKTSALAEVYKKMPEQLRPFILKLFCESEVDAAGFEVNSLTAGLKEALNAKPSGSEMILAQKRNDAQRRKANALMRLQAYIQLYYSEGAYNSHAYYTLLDNAMKHEGIETIPDAFLPGSTRDITYEKFLNLYKSVDDCKSYILSLTHDGTRAASYCPWLDADENVSPNIIIDEIDELNSKLIPISAKIIDIVTQLGLNPSTLPMSLILPITTQLPESDEIKKLYSGTIPEHFFSRLNQAIESINSTPIARLSFERVCKEKLMLDTNAADEFQTATRAVTETYTTVPSYMLVKASAVIDKLNKEEIPAMLTFISNCQTTEQDVKRVSEELDEILPVFSAEKETRESLLIEYYEALMQFADNTPEKLPLFAMKAKKGYEKLSAVKMNEKATLKEVAQACKLYAQLVELRKKSDEQIATLSRIYPNVSREDMLLVSSCLAKRKGGEEKPFIDGLGYVSLALRGAFDMLKYENGDSFYADDKYTALDIVALVHGVILRNQLQKAVKALYTEAKIDDVPNARNMSLIQAIDGLYSMKLSGVDFSGDCAYTVQRFITDARELRTIITALRDFIKKYNLNPIFNDLRKISPVALENFTKDIKDTRMRNACIEINRYCREDETGTVFRFITSFMDGTHELTPETDIASVFEHTYYEACALDCETRLELQGVRHDRDQLEILHSQLLGAEEDLRETQKEIIRARLCVADKNSPRFAFLHADRVPVTYARRFFKDYSEAILSLAKCLVLSPSSVSVFMRPEEYSDFDVLIMDEASQLPPQTILPAAFRAKQILLVGDQWQMPPIRHFVKKTDNGGDDEYEQVESALDLAIKNESIDIVGLQCHYRSQNETLIAYSQKKYYKDMTTFPTANPTLDGSGLKDIYVEDGCCKNAQNEPEARKILEVLHRHFAKYYDEASGILRDSIGIVVFGSNQLKLVQKMIDNDEVLSRKLNKALSNFNDLPAKLFFLTTVEAVQGQEISHLVISLTYGRNADGSTSNAFGTLNRGGLGERVFNVAVTRGCKSLTLIHSIHASDITVSSLDYLREYLNTVNLLATNDDEGGFVSDESKVNFFTKSVKNAICEMGVSEDRIVYGYGVTDRSLRIPLVVLSPDKTHAELGVFCETIPEDTGRYQDLAVKYPETLKVRGWRLHRMYIHDWYFNRGQEEELLKSVISKTVTIY